MLLCQSSMNGNLKSHNILSNLYSHLDGIETIYIYNRCNESRVQLCKFFSTWMSCIILIVKAICNLKCKLFGWGYNSITLATFICNCSIRVQYIEHLWLYTLDIHLSNCYVCCIEFVELLAVCKLLKNNMIWRSLGKYIEGYT